MNITSKIFPRPDFTNKLGQNPIIVRITIDRKVITLSLKVYVLFKDWNEIDQSVKKSDKLYLSKNLKISKVKEKILSLINDCNANDRIVSKSDVISIILNDSGKVEFFQFVENKIKSNKEYSKETKKTYFTQLSKLKKFRKELFFREIVPEFILLYKNYMIEELKNNTNTYNKSLSMLRTFVNWAKNEGIIKGNPFANIRIKKVAGKKEFLDESEINKLEKLKLVKKNHRNVLNYFLFSCFTGIRFTDIKNMTLDSIKKVTFNGKTNTILDFQMGKTKQFVQIPLIERASIYIPKEPFNNRLFKTLSNQKTNKLLKEIMLIAGINKNISFHCARHTFATYVLNSDIKLDTLSKLLGHTSIRMTEIYAKTLMNTKIEAMEKIQNKSVL